MKQNRFYLLDILRGVAALAVVFFHWKHFSKTQEDISSFPLYSIFGLFYNYGFLAVYLFFTLSGFIFFFLYYDRIKEKSLSLRNFIALRLTRLYPLYFVTLIMVLILQYIIYNSYNIFFIYPKNDLYHFILNIFFASSWGLERGFSFNYPSWSVSVEILLYFLFFITCIFISKKSYTIILMMVASLILTTIYTQIGQGIFFFFTGGLIYTLYLNKIKDISILTIFKFIFISVIVVFSAMYFAFFGNYTIIFGIIFGSLIFALILIETRWQYNEKYISKIGEFFNNISYSSYLIHFPLQLIFVIIIGMYSPFFYTDLSLFLFFGILIVLSILSFKFLETPIQKMLRNKYI